MFNKSFTLIETLIAIFLVSVGVAGALTLVSQTIAFTRITSSRLIALYLGKEGIEVVRNIRDSNFLKIHKGVEGINWDTGLTGCTAGCEADYNDPSLVSASRYLRINGGFFNYDSGPNTAFKRKIIVTSGTDRGTPILRVSVEVSWQERGKTYQVAVQENLYKWW